jgi:hypothetical protein
VSHSEVYTSVKNIFLHEQSAKYKKENNGKEELEKKVKEAKGIKEHAKFMVKSRQDRFDELIASWENLQKINEDGVIIKDPHLKRLEDAQASLRQVPKEAVKETIKNYCNALMSVADTMWAVEDAEYVNLEPHLYDLFFKL